MRLPARSVYLPAPLVVVNLLFLLLFGSCDKPDTIGLDVQPPGDKLNVNYTDTVSLFSFTVKEDSVRSDETSLNLLGSYTDSVFGLTNAGFYTQLRLSTANVNFGTGLVLDSLVLSLSYKGHYGDTSTLQQVDVYEVTEKIHRDSQYYSTRSFIYDPVALGSLSFAPRPTDSVEVGSAKQTAQLRIRLSNATGQRLLDQSGTANLASDDAFTDYFKGIYVKAADVSSSGAILYFDLLHANSKLTLYYRNATEDSLSFDFVINTQCSRVNRFVHNYSGTAIAAQLSDSTLGKNNIYLQAMAGTKAKILIPYLAQLNPAGASGINKAELVITAEPGTTGFYEAPSRLLLAASDSSGKPVFVTDEFEGTEYFGGGYNASDGSYTFTISRHLQEVLSGKTKDYGLFLMVSGAAASSHRVILGGSHHPSRKMKLIITYTKI